MLRKTISLLIVTFCSCISYAQETPTYPDLIKKAMAFYDANQYQKSADTYSKAFALAGNKSTMHDRYNAACSWSMAGNKDSAFFQLEKVAKMNYTNYTHLITDSDLVSLHNDSRWKNINDQVKMNEDRIAVKLNKPLVAILDTVVQDDQKYRQKLDDIMSRYGDQSDEMKDLWKMINYYDSINTIKVTNILDTYGWLGEDEIGFDGNQALFLVIQHSDITVQDKYIPMMRDAVKKHKAQASSLALLEDRVALRHGKRQIYGSQIHGGPNGKSWISPLEDPDHVDERRAEVGLGPLADYAKQFGIKWDVEAYKKELPEIEKKDKW